MPLKKVLNLDTLIGLTGLALAIWSLLSSPQILVSAVMFSAGIFLFLFGLNRTLGEFGPPYRIRTLINEFTIMDSRGEKVRMEVAFLVKVRRREVTIGGNACSFYPHNLKTFIAYVNSYETPVSNKHEVEHNEPKKMGNKFPWDEYYKPPLRRGQKLWIISQFDVQDEFTSNICSDFYNSFREVDKLIWKVHLPPERPSKRWWGTADYLPNKPDNYVLTESNIPTSEIEWIFEKPKKGAVYYINWEW